MKEDFSGKEYYSFKKIWEEMQLVITDELMINTNKHGGEQAICLKLNFDIQIDIPLIEDKWSKYNLLY